MLVLGLIVRNLGALVKGGFLVFNSQLAGTPDDPQGITRDNE